jgi:hypothetical protein
MIYSLNLNSLSDQDYHLILNELEAKKKYFVVSYTKKNMGSYQ